jgi:hypothetical protein
MTIEYTTKISNIYCYPKYQTFENAVFNVLWNYTGTDGTFTATVNGNTSIPFDGSAKYTPFDQLTEQEVISWVNTITEASVWAEAQEKITNSITQQSTPPEVINPTLPWSVV